MRLSLVSRPTTEPLTLQEAKDHLRVDGTDEDALITALVTASREVVENYTGRSLAVATYELRGAKLPTYVELPKADFQDILTVSYQGEAGETLLDNTGYTVIKGSIPTGVILTLPADMEELENSAVITFTAGFEAVPESLKAAMKLIIGHLYENREAVVIGSQSFGNELPMASEYLMNPYRVYSF